MYYRCLLDCILQSSRHFHLWVTTCSLKDFVYRIPLSLMLWGAFCYTQILSLPCDKTLFSLNPSAWSGNLSYLSILHEKNQLHACLVSHEWYLAHTSYILFSVSTSIACGLCSISISYLNRSVIREEKWYPV